MVKFSKGGLELELSAKVKVSDKFKKSLIRTSKIWGFAALSIVGMSFAAEHPHIRDSVNEGYTNSKKLESQIQYTYNRLSQDQSLTQFGRNMMKVRKYFGWPGRQINYLIYMDK
tara:strand:+ start:1691 stop:2032 length:342 start_codon:yes stop_codon:yes gene_type:complete